MECIKEENTIFLTSGIVCWNTYDTFKESKLQWTYCFRYCHLKSLLVIVILILLLLMDLSLLVNSFIINTSCDHINIHAGHKIHGY